MTELHASAKFPILYKTNDLAHPVKRFFNDAWNGKFFLESKVPKPAGSRGSRILSNIPHRFRILEKRYAKKNLPNSSAWVVATKMFAAVRLSLDKEVKRLIFNYMYQSNQRAMPRVSTWVTMVRKHQIKPVWDGAAGDFFGVLRWRSPLKPCFWANKPKKIACGAPKNNISFW